MIITKRNLVGNNLYYSNILINRKNKIVRGYEYQEITRLISSLIFNFKKRITIFNNKLIEFNQLFSRFMIVVEDFLVKVATFVILLSFIILMVLIILIFYIIVFIFLDWLIDCFERTARFIHRKLQKVLSKVKELLRYLFYSQSEELETLRMINQRLLANIDRIRRDKTQLSARYNRLLVDYRNLIRGRLTSQAYRYERTMRLYLNLIIYRLAQLEQASRGIDRAL